MKIKSNMKEMDRVVKELLQDSITDPIEMIRKFAGRVYRICLENEMDEHLGYSHNSFEPKETENRRNGSTLKTLQTELGELEIRRPRDCNGSFNPIIVPKC